MLTAFAKCSILDVWWGSEYTSGYTGLLVATKRAVLVACLLHPHIDGVIIFVFCFFLFHTPLLIFGTQSGATKLGQGSRISHLRVPFLAGESLSV